MRFIAPQILALALASCGLESLPVPLDLRVHISGAGECSVGHEVMPCEGLGAYVKGLHAQSWCDIHIEVDRESQYQFVASALNSLKKAGFNKVGFGNNNLQMADSKGDH